MSVKKKSTQTNNEVVINPIIAMIKKAIWVAKLRSTVVVVSGLSISLGKNMNMTIRRIGIKIPIRL